VTVMPDNAIPDKPLGPTTMPRAALWLGGLGVIPFLVLSVSFVIMAGAWQATAVMALQYYAAIILSFLGGLHWAMAMDSRNPWQYVYAVMPSLFAWVCLLLPADSAFFLLSFGFVLAFYVDRGVFGRGHWFTGLRAVLTLVVCAALYLAYRHAP